MKNKTLTAAIIGLGIVTICAAIAIGKRMGQKLASMDADMGWGDGDCGYDCDCDDCICGRCCEDEEVNE